MPEPALLRPLAVLGEVEQAIPQDLRAHLVIVGSLAAAYHLLPGHAQVGVRTKDVDCVFVPSITAAESGRAVAERLLAAGWTHRSQGAFGAPGGPETPDHRLPVVGLIPPSAPTWFLEILAEPPQDPSLTREWRRLPLSTGHFGIPIFPFMGLAVHRAHSLDSGVKLARPQMMALANLLEHREFSDAVIEGSTLLGRPARRRNKDLGRVLAIAQLSPADTLDQWATEWRDALVACFPKSWRTHAGDADAGLRRLVRSEEDLLEATEHCNTGLLARDPQSMDTLRVVGERVLELPLADLRRLAEIPATGP